VLLVLLVLVPHYSHLHWPGRRALRQCHIQPVSSPKGERPHLPLF
jgi:hypothetical protein